MTDHAPDLVQRAAARLQQGMPRLDTAEPTVAASAVEKLRSQSPFSAHFEALESKRTPERLAMARRLQQVTISPTRLAANGIALPSSGLSRTVEEFRALKRHVLSNAMRSGTVKDSSANRTVLVTSARAGEGKTFTAANLAFALAYERDTRVLLMDADAYRQSLMNYLGISGDSGWLDAFGSKSVALDEIVLGTNVPGLSVLPSGKASGEIPEIMASHLMTKLLDELARQDPSRFIIIDSLPCLTSIESSILAGLVGQTLFVVAAHQTSREDIETSLRLLNASPSVNLVLNKTEPLLSEQFKGYGYAYASQR